MRGGPRRFNPGFTCPDLLRNSTGEPREFRLRASNPLRTDLPDRSATRAFCNSSTALWDGHAGPTTPNTQRPQAFTHSVWAISPFARHYSGNRDFLYFPPGTQMCHFPGFPPPALCVQTGVTRYDPCRVSPFGDPCFKARLRLHTAYRSLPRPSSASGAKASTIRSYYLNGIGFALCGFQKSDAFALAGTAPRRKTGPQRP